MQSLKIMKKILVVSRFGLEKMTKIELNKLGYSDVEVSDGQLIFMGDDKDIARANVHLRTAERVMIVLGEFKAYSFDDLYEGIGEIKFGEYLSKNPFIHVTAKSVRSKVYSITDIQSVSKKAIVDVLKEKHKIDWIEETGTRYRIEVGILKDNVTVCLDTSGDGLHKRGYRKLVGEAPLSETLASALILLSNWHPKKVLVDPFCGSGTIPIEAALIAIDHAPGINRSFRGEEYESFLGKKVFDEVKMEALDKVNYDKETKIIGTDISEEALKMARFHAEQAGVADNIHFQRMDVKDMWYPDENGCIITNPPYGERLMDDDEIIELYNEVRTTFDKFPTWSKYIIYSIYGI